MPAPTYLFPDQSIWTIKTTPDGAPDNPLVKYAEALFAKARLPFHAETYPSARMFAMLREKPGGFAMLVDSPTVRDCCLVSAHLVARTDLMAYRRDELPALIGPQDIKGRHIILIRGYSYGELAGLLHDPANNIKIDQAATHETGFGMLERGHGDYLLDYVGPANEVLAERPYFRLARQKLARSEVRLVLSKDFPHAEELMRRLDAAVDGLPRVKILGKDVD